MKQPAGYVTVVETVYHQVVNQQPMGIPHNFQVALESDAVPNVRRVSVTGEWQPIDLGWIEKPSMIHIVNEEGRRFSRNPSEAERLSVAERVVEVGYEGAAFLEVRPGRSERLTPVDAGRLRVRCRSGSAVCTVTVYPG